MATQKRVSTKGTQWAKFRQTLRRRLRPLVNARRKAATISDKRYRGNHEIVYWSGNKFDTQNALGFYTYGSCHLRSVAFIEPFFKRKYNGSVVNYYETWNASKSRTDVMLQSIQELPRELIEEMAERLQVGLNFFHSYLDHPHFSAQTHQGAQTFNKDVVFLSTASDIVRNVYRHKDSGILVDPGGWWLNQSMDKVLKDLDTVKWFKNNFESLGRLSIEQSMDNYREIVKIIRANGNPHIVIYNILSTSPGDKTYNYQLLRNPEVVRRLEFNLAIEELVKELDIIVFDLDKVIRSNGIADGQIDFAHWPEEEYGPISQHVFSMLDEMKVFDRLESI